MIRNNYNSIVDKTFFSLKGSFCATSHDNISVLSFIDRTADGTLKKSDLANSPKSMPTIWTSIVEFETKTVKNHPVKINHFACP